MTVLLTDVCKTVYFYDFLEISTPNIFAKSRRRAFGECITIIFIYVFLSMCLDVYYII